MSPTPKNLSCKPNERFQSLKDTLYRPPKITKKGVLITIATFVCIAFILSHLLNKYKESANRAACFVNQSSIEKAYDSYQGLASGEDTQIGSIEELWSHYGSAPPTCPSGGIYVIGSSPEAIYSGQEPYVRCSHKHHEYQRIVNRQKDFQDRTNKLK